MKIKKINIGLNKNENSYILSYESLKRETISYEYIKIFKDINISTSKF